MARWVGRRSARRRQDSRGPGVGAIGGLCTRRCTRRRQACTTASHRRRRLLCAYCDARPGGTSEAVGPLLCSPRRGPRGPHDQSSLPCSLATEEAAARPVSDDEHSPPWRHVRVELRRAVSEATWHQWLEPLRARELANDVLVVEAPDEIRAWVVDHFGRLLQACAAAVLGPQVQ